MKKTIHIVMFLLLCCCTRAQHVGNLPEAISRTYEGKTITFLRKDWGNQADYETHEPFRVGDTTFLYKAYHYWRCDTCHSYQIDSSYYFILSRKLRDHERHVYNAMAVHWHKTINGKVRDVESATGEYGILKESHPKLVVNDLGEMPRVWYMLSKYKGKYCFSIDSPSCMELTDSLIIFYDMEMPFAPLSDFKALKSGGWSYTTSDYHDSPLHVTIVPCRKLKGGYIITYTRVDGSQYSRLVTNERHLRRFDVIDYESTYCMNLGLEGYDAIDLDAIK